MRMEDYAFLLDVNKTMCTFASVSRNLVAFFK